MDDAGKVNDIGMHKKNIKTYLGNSGWVQGADIHDVHIAADTGFLAVEEGHCPWTPSLQRC